MIFDLKHPVLSVIGNKIAIDLQISFCGIQQTETVIQKQFKGKYFFIFYDRRTRSILTADRYEVAKNKLVRLRKQFEKPLKKSLESLQTSLLEGV